MRVAGVKIASIAVTGALGAISVAAWMHLPEGARLPVHWNAAGEADRFAGAAGALAMPPLLCAAISILLWAVPYIDPIAERREASGPLRETAWIGLLAMMVLVELHVAGAAFGLAMSAATIPVALGLLLILIGNVLPKSRPNFFVGIRTPWTISDPENWIATHRLGAWTTMAGGALLMLSATLPVAWRAPILIAALLIAFVPPVAYSFLYWWARRA
jgi:uncharacterized membrane protein